MNSESTIQNFINSGLFDRKLVLNRNQLLKGSGTIDTDIYWIQEGSLKIYIVDNEEERIIRFGYDGNIIVSLDSFLSGKPSDFYIQAIKKTTVFIASKSNFEKFIDASEDNLKLWNSILQDLVLQQVEREKDILIHSPKERYERVLKRSPKLFQLIPSKYIANYLRMTPETLSRLKKS